MKIRYVAVRAVCALSIVAAGVGDAFATQPPPPSTATPVQHVVVIFQENVSFDHYFSTYPAALNPNGEPFFQAVEGTPAVNNLGTLVEGKPSRVLLTNNPNFSNAGNGANAINPFRLDRTQASTCDQDHNYGHEQQAFDNGLMDLFPATVGVGGNAFCNASFAYGKGKGLTMGYFDGNTVTALWNYTQNFALNDNFYGSTFGPSTPGLLNLVAGNTYPATLHGGTSNKVVPVPNSTGTLVGDLDPTGDVCSGASATIEMGGQSIGDILSAAAISWGSFMGGFDLTIVNPPNSQNPNPTTGCARSSAATPANGGPTADYIPHHAFFQYWASTLNANHTRPTSVAMIGQNGDAANHEYDIHDFFDAMNAGNVPAVSFLKAPAFEDGHAGYSDPLLEQQFIVNTANAIMNSKFWKDTAIFITYDDSDGWYDHQMSPIVNSSAVANPSDTKNSDQLNGPGKCGNGAPLENGGTPNVPIQGRCGYGTRLPFLTISPFAKANFVDSTLTDHSSIIKFIEDNWGTGRIGGGSFDAIAGPLTNMFDFNQRGFGASRLILDPSTGQPD